MTRWAYCMMSSFFLSSCKRAGQRKLGFSVGFVFVALRKTDGLPRRWVSSVAWPTAKKDKGQGRPGLKWQQHRLWCIFIIAKIVTPARWFENLCFLVGVVPSQRHNLHNEIAQIVGVACPRRLQFLKWGQKFQMVQPPPNGHIFLGAVLVLYNYGR